MEEKKRNYKSIVNGVVTSLIASVILIIINSSLTLFYKEKVNISISSSSYIDNNYITTINIKNYQETKSISEINLWIKNNKINEIKTDIINDYNSLINNVKLQNIMPNYNGVIVIYSEEAINEENLEIELGEKSNIVYLSSQKESAYIKIWDYIKTMCIYFVEFAILLIIIQKSFDKKADIINQKCDELELQTQENEKRMNKILEDRLRNKLILHKKIADYSRELNFWKDTIRKLLYKVGDKKIDENTIFKVVTQNLETYRTSEKCDYREIENIILELKNKEV